eukprot:scaffold615_cov387-Pavlova_lutheri.AAC.4
MNKFYSKPPTHALSSASRHHRSTQGAVLHQASEFVPPLLVGPSVYDHFSSPPKVESETKSTRGLLFSLLSLALNEPRPLGRRGWTC